MLELYTPESVVDVGCGVGTWLAAFAQHGVDDVLGVDGDYVARARYAMIPRSLVHPVAYQERSRCANDPGLHAPRKLDVRMGSGAKRSLRHRLRL